MQNTTERPSFIPWILLGVLSIIWGSSFILMKRGLDAYDPIQVAGLRLSISFLAMLPFALRNVRKVKRKDWPFLVIVGWAGSGFPAFLFALAQTRISSAVAGMLNSLTPIFTLAIGMLFFGLIFRRSWLWGILLGLIGVFLIIGQVNHWTLGNTGWFALAALGGTFFYAISGNTVKAHLQHLDSMTIGSLGFSTVGIPALLVLFSTDFVVSAPNRSGRGILPWICGHPRHIRDGDRLHPVLLPHSENRPDFWLHGQLSHPPGRCRLGNSGW